MTKAILEKWMVAQKRHRLSDKQVQMVTILFSAMTILSAVFQPIK